MTGPSLNVLDIKDPLQKGIEQGQQQRVSQQTIAVNDQTIASNDQKLKTDVSNLAITQLESASKLKKEKWDQAATTYNFVTSMLSTAADQGQDAVDKVIKAVSENAELTNSLTSIGFNINDMAFKVEGKKIVSAETRTLVTADLIKQLTANGGPAPTGKYIDIKSENGKIVGWKDIESATNPSQYIGTPRSLTTSETKALQDKMQNAYLEIQKNTLKGESPDPNLVNMYEATYGKVPGFKKAPTVGIKDPPKGTIVNIPSEADKTKSIIDKGKVISGAVNATIKDATYARSSKQINAADTVLTMLSAPGTLTAVAIRPQLIRLFGDVGNIALGETEAVRKFGNIKDRIETILAGASTGLLTQKAITEIKTLTMQFKKVATASLNNSVKQRKLTFQDAYGDIFPQKRINQIFSRYLVNSTNPIGTTPSSKPLGGGTGAKTSGTTPSSKPKPLSNADSEARAWAKKNPNDPRAKEIMKYGI